MELKGQKICLNCVMDETDEDITFDENGICDHCNLFFHRDQNTWDNCLENKYIEGFRSFVENLKKTKNGPYDCIIGLSGGCDSSYMLHKLVTEFGLKPLCLHVDAGWNTKAAVSNINNMVSKLGLDLIVDVIDWDEMRELQLAFLRAGVSHQDTPQDHAFFATLHKYAERYKIRTIFSGGNISTEAVIVPIKWMYYTSDVWQLSDIEKRFCKIPLIKFPRSSVLHRKVISPYLKRTKVFHPLNSFRYIKKEGESFLSSNYNFEAFDEKHYESVFTKYYEAIYLPKKFGYDTRKVTYSSLILTGQMTRDLALKKLSSSPLSLDDEIRLEKYVADKLHICLSTLRDMVFGENKSYNDYRNQAYLYNFGAAITKRIPGMNASGAKR